MKVIIYISNWNAIGGVETFTENFCKRMSNHFDITLIYDNINNVELATDLAQYCKTIKIDKTKTYTADFFINSTAWGFCPYDNIKAKKVIQIVHADYRHVIANWNFKYNKHKNTTHHVAVGELVKTAFEEATPYKIDAVIYNLLDNTNLPSTKPNNDKLTLITVSRLSGEKGFDRMLKLAKQLTDAKIDFVWNVYGNINNNYNNAIVNRFKPYPSVKFKGVIKNPTTEINNADYLIQLSDTEGFAYSVYEALQVKTPCIITPFASGNEQITDCVNGYIVPFDMEGIDLNKIKNNIPKVKDFKEVGSEKAWIDFLIGAVENKYKPKPRKDIQAIAKCTRNYHDTVLNQKIAKNQELTVSLNRLQVLLNNNVCELIEIL